MLDKDKAGRVPEVGDDNRRKPDPSTLFPLIARLTLGLSTVLALAVVVVPSPVFAQAAPPPPAVTVSQPLQEEHHRVGRVHRPVRGRSIMSRSAPGSAAI